MASNAGLVATNLTRHYRVLLYFYHGGICDVATYRRAARLHPVQRHEDALHVAGPCSPPRAL